MLPKDGISLCMIVKDEEDFLSDCLDSVKGLVDEMIIVDTGSLDNTVDIAKSKGATVSFYCWQDNFAAARNYSMARAQYKWILLLDADERLESKDISTLKEFIKTTDCDGAHFRVVNYVGDKQQGGQYTVHNALRLVRNNKQYEFRGAIHEQIARIDNRPIAPGAFCITGITLRHLGYLDGVVQKKDKRARNLPLLLKELESKPADAFVLFNLGNEFMASGDYNKAVELYQTAEKSALANQAFTPHLYYRNAMCRYGLGDYGSAVAAADRGLALYPGCTDLVFLKGLVYFDERRNILALECFEQALSMGEAHPTLRFNDGSGTVAPVMAMAELFEREGDYKRSAELYIKALSLDGSKYSALYKAAAAFCRLGMSQKEITGKLSSFFADADYPPNQIMLTDVLLSCKLYQGAYELLDKLAASKDFEHEKNFLRGRYYLYTGEHKEAIRFADRALKGIGNPNIFAGFEEAAAVSAFIAAMADGCPSAPKKRASDAMVKVFGKTGEGIAGQVKALFSGKTDNLLSCCDRAKTLSLIQTILGELLQAHAFELFERLLYLYNYVDSKGVLLSLAKVYMAQDLPGFAAQSLIRSAAELDYFNRDAAFLLADAYALLPYKAKTADKGASEDKVERADKGESADNAASEGKGASADKASTDKADG